MIFRRPGRRAATAAAALILPFCSPLLAATPHLGGGDALHVSLGRIVGALFVSILVVIGAILLIRQRGGRNDLQALVQAARARPRAVDVLETRRLSPHADICLVRHKGEDYLLLLSAGSARVLSRSEAAKEAGAEA